MTAVELRDLAKQYRSGVSIRALATECGMSYGSMRLRLLAAGVELRSRGGARAENAFKRAATKRAAKTTGR